MSRPAARLVMRWGHKGSFRLKLDTGTWSDFEAGEGGGVLALVMREEGLDKASALAWLETQGFLSNRRERGRSGAYGPVSGKSVATQSPYSPTIRGSTTILTLCYTSIIFAGCVSSFCRFYSLSDC